MSQGESGTTVELTFEIRDDDCFFVAASDRLSCRVVCEDVIHRRDGNYLEFVTVEAPLAESLAVAQTQDDVERARVISEDESGCLLELVVERERCVIGTLADTHAVVKEAYAEDGIGFVVAEAPGHADSRTIVETMQDHYRDTALRAKRHREGAELAAVTGGPDTERYLSRLTAKQREAVRAAVRGGYLAWPRRSTASECAEALDISQPTFSQHLYRGLDTLLSALFDEATEDDPVPSNR